MAARSVKQAKILHDEHQAWRDVCTEFRTVVGDINDKKYNKLVSLLHDWAAQQHLLRKSEGK
jgi:hypothetical protein